jgi:hypothetical protein
VCWDAYNTTFLGGGGEDHSLGLAWGKCARTYLKKKLKQKGQGCGSSGTVASMNLSSKPQYHQKNCDMSCFQLSSFSNFHCDFFFDINYLKMHFFFS